ncbi:MAG: hypothetical protein AAF747_07800 [Planctomycetota bacterium]
MTQHATTTLEAAVLNHATPARRLAMPLKIASWVAQVAAAFILGQTLFFKLTAAPETVALFQVVAGDANGKAMMYATALGELTAVVLILIPRTAAIGGLMVMGVMTGAIGAHFATNLGISIDPVALGKPELEPLTGPSLFVMGVVAWLAGAAVAVIRRKQLPVVGKWMP